MGSTARGVCVTRDQGWRWWAIAAAWAHFAALGILSAFPAPLPVPPPIRLESPPPDAIGASEADPVLEVQVVDFVRSDPRQHEAEPVDPIAISDRSTRAVRSA